MLIAARHLGLLGEKRADLVRSLPDLRNPIEMAVRSGQRPAFDRCPGGCNLLDRVLHDRFVEDEIIGGVEYERRHLDLRRVDRRDLVGFAEVKKVIGIRDDSASSRRLIEEAFDLELIRECFGGILAFVRRCRSESLARPLPAVGLQSNDLERCLQALSWRLLVVVIAVIPFRIEPDGLRPRV